LRFKLTEISSLFLFISPSSQNPIIPSIMARSAIQNSKFKIQNSKFKIQKYAMTEFIAS